MSLPALVDNSSPEVRLWRPASPPPRCKSDAPESLKLALWNPFRNLPQSRFHPSHRRFSPNHWSPLLPDIFVTPSPTKNNTPTLSTLSISPTLHLLNSSAFTATDIAASTMASRPKNSGKKWPKPSRWPMNSAPDLVARCSSSPLPTGPPNTTGSSRARLPDPTTPKTARSTSFTITLLDKLSKKPKRCVMKESSKAGGVSTPASFTSTPVAQIPFGPAPKAAMMAGPLR